MLSTRARTLFGLVSLLAIAACADTTAPTPSSVRAPAPAGADEIAPPDSTCRGGWSSSSGRAC